MPRWFRCFDKRPAASIRLICFPYAGGSAAFYRPWHKHVAPAIEIQAVQYPGRADRMREPLIDDAAPLARAIAAAMPPLLDRPVALYGHSMGALVAYEVARLLSIESGPAKHGAHPLLPIESGPAKHGAHPLLPIESRPAPTRLFVSGSAAAHQADREEVISHLPDDAFVKKLSKLGGDDVGVLETREIWDLVLPYVRNDCRLSENYVHKDGMPLSIPIHAFFGTEDPLTNSHKADHWAELTTAECTVTSLPGDHFFLVPQQSAVLTEIHHHLGEVPPHPAP